MAPWHNMVVPTLYSCDHDQPLPLDLERKSLVRVLNVSLSLWFHNIYLIQTFESGVKASEWVWLNENKRDAIRTWAEEVNGDRSLPV